MRTIKIGFGLVAALGALGAATLDPAPRFSRSFGSETGGPGLTAAMVAVPPVELLPAPGETAEAPTEAERDVAPERAAPGDANGMATFSRDVARRQDDDPSASARVAPQRSPEGQVTTAFGGSVEGARADDFSSLPPIDAE
jgi:hypothetical protein